MRILYIYSRPKETEIESNVNHRIPTDHYYMAIELRNMGHHVDFNNDRFVGIYGKAAQWFRKKRGINIVPLQTLWECRKYDIVVLKDDFSMLVSIACYLWGVKLINMDDCLCVSVLPKNILRRAIYWISFKVADSIVTYSNSQALLWSNEYNIPINNYASFPYAIDVTYYINASENMKISENSGDYILSVGCDDGRDYMTLVKAINGLDIKLKLVSIPARIQKEMLSENIQYYNKLSYSELVDMYRGALFVVVPIKRGIIYPCGIRAMLEAMVLGKAVIVSGTMVLKEYLQDGKEGIFVEPGDHIQLRKEIERLFKERETCRTLGLEAKKAVMERYDIRLVSKQFEKYLVEVVNR